MNIIYRINQANTVDSITNAKNVSRSLNLDNDNKSLRIVPQGEESTSGIEIPSTGSSVFGKVYCGIDGEGKRIYKELTDLVVGTSGVEVSTKIGTSGEKLVEVKTNLKGTSGITVQEVNGNTEIGFSTDNNIDGLRGFSYTRFAAGPFNIENSSLNDYQNPDWIKQMDSSNVIINENSRSKVYQFVSNRNGIWNVNFGFNDTWNSITPLNSLVDYVPGDFGRPFDVKIDIIKKDQNITGASQNYYMVYNTDISKFQPLTLGTNSKFKVSRSNSSVESSVYVWKLYLDEQYNLITYSKNPIRVEFSADESEIEKIEVMDDAIDGAKYIMWSFSKLEKIAKTIAPNSPTDIITICHQTVRSVVDNINVDNSFDKSFWLLLQEGDTVRATCTFSTGDSVPICDVSMGALYMLPGVTIGGSGSGQILYDIIVNDFTDFKTAITINSYNTIFVATPITITENLVSSGDKNVYGLPITYESSNNLSSSGPAKFINIYNNIIFSGNFAISNYFDNVRLRNVISSGTGIKTISSNSGYVCQYELNRNPTTLTINGTKNYWDTPIETTEPSQMIYGAVVSNSTELVTALKDTDVVTIYVKKFIELVSDNLTGLTTKDIYGELVSITRTNTQQIKAKDDNLWISFYNDVVLRGPDFTFDNVRFKNIKTDVSASIAISSNPRYVCQYELNRSPTYISGGVRNYWTTPMTTYIDKTSNEDDISGIKTFNGGIISKSYTENVYENNTIGSGGTETLDNTKASFLLYKTDDSANITIKPVKSGSAALTDGTKYTVAVLPNREPTKAYTHYINLECGEGTYKTKGLTNCDCLSFYYIKGKLLWIN